jgi:hypothetical protein
LPIVASVLLKVHSDTSEATLKTALIMAILTSLFLIGCARTRSDSSTSTTEIDNANIRFEQLKQIGTDLRNQGIDLNSEAKTKTALQSKSLVELVRLRALVKRFCENGRSILDVAAQPDVDYPATEQLRTWVRSGNAALRAIDLRIETLGKAKKPSAGGDQQVVKTPGTRLSDRGLSDDMKRCATYLKSQPKVENVSILTFEAALDAAKVRSLSRPKAERVRIAAQTALACLDLAEAKQRTSGTETATVGRVKTRVSNLISAL